MGVWDPQNVDLLNPKSGLFEPHPLNPLTKTPVLAHFVTKSGPFGRFGRVSRTPHPLAMGLVAFKTLGADDAVHKLLHKIKMH